MIEAILVGDLALKSINREARSYGNSVIARFADKFGARSLDEIMPGTDDLRRIDTIVDDSSSSWLEEMGATVY